MKRRNFLKVTSLSILTNCLESPNATATSCMGFTPLHTYITPRESLTNLTEPPYARYLDAYYDKHEFSPVIEENFHIKTLYRAENFSHIPVKIHCPHVKYSDPLLSNLFVKKIDVLEQIINRHPYPFDKNNDSYRDKYGHISNINHTINEGPVHFITSIENTSSPVEYFSFNYRRRFSYSRLILIFTTFNKESNQSHSISVGISKVLRDGRICEGGKLSEA